MDPFFLYFGLIFLVATALVILISVRYLQIEDEHHGEYYALLLFATVGMMFMAGGYDLIVQFLGLETMAISFYILTGFLRHPRRSNEAAVKYLLLGAFSSGLLAYGFSLLYGISAMADLNGPLRAAAASAAHQSGRGAHGLGCAGPTDLLVMLAVVTVSAGLFFKVAAVPFHQWAPDVYEGAPTHGHGLRQRGVEDGEFRAAAAPFPLRLLAGARDWVEIIAVVAVASLTVGNFAAITQSNVKRLLAYSSISHVGYILLGLVAALSGPDGNETGLKGIAFYLFVYAFMTIGAFAIVIVLRRQGLIGDELDDMNGLIERSPTSAVLLLIFMLSLAGIPPLAGFVGKYYILLSLIETQHYYLALFGALYIVPALYYYFRIVVHAWLREPASDGARDRDAGPVGGAGGDVRRDDGRRHISGALHSPGHLFADSARSTLCPITVQIRRVPRAPRRESGRIRSPAWQRHGPAVRAGRQRGDRRRPRLSAGQATSTLRPF